MYSIVFLAQKLGSIQVSQQNITFDVYHYILSYRKWPSHHIPWLPKKAFHRFASPIQLDKLFKDSFVNYRIFFFQTFANDLLRDLIYPWLMLARRRIASKASMRRRRQHQWNSQGIKCNMEQWIPSIFLCLCLVEKSTLRHRC